MDPKQSRTIPIQGVKVHFPFKPYPSQLSMMAKIIKGIGTKQNCLLESPTGTGKSLALLCSALAWQQQCQQESEKCIEKPPCCCKCHRRTSPECNDPMAATSKYFQDTSPSMKNEDGQSMSKSCDPSDMNSSHHDDDDFQMPKTQFKTPVGNITKKRTHTPIAYEEGEDHSYTKQMAKTPSAWKMEVTSTRANTPLGDVTGSGCCKSEKEQCYDCDCASTMAKHKEAIRVPTIYYCTRTHRQIKQIARELGRTAYRGTLMTILSSRDHSCINGDVLKMSNRNDGCREKVDLHACRFFEKSKRISHQVLKESGLDSAWDIEDFKEVCASLRCCPYYSAREIRTTAQLVFCPYNYLIDPVIRSAMEITLKDQIVILDEAHNAEDFSRDAASGNFPLEQLEKASQDFDMMVNENVKPEDHNALKNMVDNIIQVIRQNSEYLVSRGFDEGSKTWAGTELVVMLDRMGIGRDRVQRLQQHFAAVCEENDQDETRRRNKRGKVIKLPNPTVMLMKNLFEVLRFISKENMKYLEDYRLALIKKTDYRAGPTNNRWLNKRQRGRQSTDKTFVYSLHFWCLNPAVAFSDLEDVRCIILTSGTLSPLKSFESELGMLFPIQLEANHVINNNQVLVGTIGKGPKGGQLLASYQKSETYEFQDETGSTLLEICKTIPYGVLCFVSSYKMLEKLRNRWQMTGLWSDIGAIKSVFCEPRASDAEDFDEVIKNYYESIREAEATVSSHGGLLFAVCRGKVSEGIDFSDNNARAVITIGIPFPNIKDAQVELKRKYNDMHMHRGVLSGSEWYEIQAYRALNQALGRCIRHRKDWGAIILVDERFCFNGNKYVKGISKWVRQKVTNFHSFYDIKQALKSFSEEMKLENELNDTMTSPVADTSVCASPYFPNPTCSTPNVQQRQQTNYASPQLRGQTPCKPTEMYSVFTPTTTKIRGRQNRGPRKSTSPQELNNLNPCQSVDQGSNVVNQIAIYPDGRTVINGEVSVLKREPELLAGNIKTEVGADQSHGGSVNAESGTSVPGAESVGAKVKLEPVEATPGTVAVDSDVQSTCSDLKRKRIDSDASNVRTKSDENQNFPGKKTKRVPKGVVYDSPEKSCNRSEQNARGVKLEESDTDKSGVYIYSGFSSAKKIDTPRGSLDKVRKMDEKSSSKCDETDDKQNVYTYSGYGSSKKIDAPGEICVPGRKKLFKFVNNLQTSKCEKSESVCQEVKLEGNVCRTAGLLETIKTDQSELPDREQNTSPLLFDDSNEASANPNVQCGVECQGVKTETDNAKVQMSTRSRLAKFRFSKSEDGAKEEEEKLDETCEEKIKTKRVGRKRRGSSGGRRSSRRKSADMLDQMEAGKNVPDLVCQQCDRVVATSQVCDEFQKAASPLFLLKTGLTSREAYVFEKEKAVHLLKSLEVHVPSQSVLCNSYWSADDGCCVQFLVCKQCSKDMFLPVGAQVLATSKEASQVKEGQIWLSSEAFHCSY